MKAPWILACVVALLPWGAWAGTSSSSADAGRTAAALQRPYGELLSTYLGPDGTVSYERWHANAADRARLENYLTQMTRSSPDQAPQLYGSSADQLGYWINLYNAVVIREILRRWPLSSVKEVTGRDGGLQSGNAFFKDLTFPVGKRQLTLDQLEGEIIRGTFKDARIHFAINCGSRSCPRLKPEAFVGPRLSEQLDAASRAFVNNAQNVSVNDADRTLVLSTIFDWFQKDFVEFARTHAQKADLIGFLTLYAEPSLTPALQRARSKDYRIVFRDYDWGLNAAKQDAPDAGLGQPLVDAAWPLLDGGTWRPSDDLGKVIIIDFWASYCRPCKTSFPQLETLFRQYRKQGLTVIGIAQEASSPETAAFLRETRVTFPIATDARSVSAEPPLDVTQLPTELVIDRKGRVRLRQFGWAPGDFEKLSAEVKRLLEER